MGFQAYLTENKFKGFWGIQGLVGFGRDRAPLELRGVFLSELAPYSGRLFGPCLLGFDASAMILLGGLDELTTQVFRGLSRTTKLICPGHKELSSRLQLSARLHMNKFSNPAAM